VPRIRGLAHITGGGIVDNLPRVLPPGVRAIVRRSSWRVPPLFSLIQRAGQVEREEMDRVFNMGVGMIVVARPEDVAPLLKDLDSSWVLGEVVERGEGQGPLEMV
jgi:phosphoribosylformylglycinamidine cyclo-ligase